MNETKCDACGKSMTFDNGSETGLTVIGISLQLNVKETSQPGYKAFIQKQLGPYLPDHNYNVCWECWLRSIGVVPEG